MRVPWRRLTWVLIAAVPIVAIAGVVWVATRDLSRYQARLTEQIRKVTGRELAAKVPLAVKLGSEPAMVAEGVTLSNAPWGSRPEMARVRKLTLYIDPVSLFLGEIKIGRILLEGADILQGPLNAIYTRSVTDPAWGVRATQRRDNFDGTVLVTRDDGGGLVLLPNTYGTNYASQDFKSVASFARSAFMRWTSTSASE